MDKGELGKITAQLREAEAAVDQELAGMARGREHIRERLLKAKSVVSPITDPTESITMGIIRRVQASEEVGIIPEALRHIRLTHRGCTYHCLPLIFLVHFVGTVG